MKHSLRVGGLVLIPEQLLVRRDKPSKSFIKKVKKKVNLQAAPAPESLMNVIIEEPIDPTQDNTGSIREQQKVQLEDEFLGQIIDSTKLRLQNNELEEEEAIVPKPDM